VNYFKIDSYLLECEGYIILFHLTETEKACLIYKVFSGHTVSPLL